MLKDLATFFLETEGGRNVPASLRPGFVKYLSQSLLGHGGKVIASGQMPEGGRFQISQHKHGQDMWMEIFRPDNTLEEQWQYRPTAKAYATQICRFNDTGKLLLDYEARAQDGRLVEEVSRNEHNQLISIRHNYPDLRTCAYEERGKHARPLRCFSVTKRSYDDMAGEIPCMDEHFDDKGNLVKEVLYEKDGKTLLSITTFYPGTGINQQSTVFADNGLKVSETSYDKEGRQTRYIKFDSQIPPAEGEQQRIIEDCSFKNGNKSVERFYYDDGALRMTRHYEANGRHIKQERLYNATGEYVREIRDYKAGKLARKVQMQLRGDVPEISRVILYDKGRPYRSREHYTWENTGDDFWAETEIDPKSGRLLSSLIPTPTGLIRHTYDPTNGRRKFTERHREEWQGETVQERTFYHAGPPVARHPERNTPNKVSRIERLEEDGHTIDSAQNFRTDGSIKSESHREPDGSWTHRVFPPGTTEIDFDTPVVYESRRRPDGTMESSTLHSHSDPSIHSIHKEYDTQGHPHRVFIEKDSGTQELSWEEYAQRRAQERKNAMPELVKLATITPAINNDNDGQTHFGRTFITLQGTEEALEKTRQRLEAKIPGTQCKLYTGEEAPLQFRNMTGRYVEKHPNIENNPLIEKVNVLSVMIPFSEQKGDNWPKHFPQAELQDAPAQEECVRAIIEAAEALHLISLHTRCDLGLSAKPVIGSRQNGSNDNVFYPYVVLQWPNKPYLPPAQNEVIAEFLSEQLQMHGYDCTHKIKENHLDVLVSKGAFSQGTAINIARNEAMDLSRMFIPAAVRKSLPEIQL